MASFIYEIIGEGEPILFLSGWNNSYKKWYPITSILKTKYKCILLQLPGFDNSPVPEYAYDVIDYANYVYEFLSYLNIKVKVMVGHSFGCKVITEFNLYYYPTKIIYTGASIIKPKDTIKKKIVRYKVRKYKARNMNIDKFGSVDYVNSRGIMRKILVKAVNTYYDDKLYKIKVPVLVYWGKNDLDTPLWMGKKIKKIIKTSKLIVVEGDHFAHLTNNFNFASTVDDFIIKEF